MRKWLACFVGAALVSACNGDGPDPQPTPTVTSVAVSGAANSVTVGGTVQFTATANRSDGSNQNVSNSASWTSTNTGVATVSNTGLATAVGAGTTEIRATHQGFAGGAQLLVNPAGPTINAAFIVQSVPDNVLDTCRLSGSGDLNCSFIGSASSSSAGPIVNWIWQFSAAGFQSNEIQDTDPFLDPQSTCGFFNNNTSPAGANFVQMIVSLRVRDNAGNVSATTTNPNVRLFPQQNCGFTF
jgi:hypothetical protein